MNAEWHRKNSYSIPLYERSVAHSIMLMGCSYPPGGTPSSRAGIVICPNDKAVARAVALLARHVRPADTTQLIVKRESREYLR